MTKYSCFLLALFHLEDSTLLVCRDRKNPFRAEIYRPKDSRDQKTSAEQRILYQDCSL